MIYTTYFAKLKSLPKNVIPISVSAKTPEWYRGAKLKTLAPKYSFFSKWKETHDNDYYIRHYNAEVLAGLNPHRLVNALSLYLPDPSCHIALVCYEKPGTFCHRHLIAKWLQNAGYPCEEFVYN